MKFSHLGCKCIFQEPKRSNKISTPGMRRPFWVVSHDCSRDSQYVLVYCSFHWLFPETGKSLLLNTPSTWDRTQRLLNWNYLNSSSLKTSCLVLEDTVEDLKGRKQPTVLCSCNAYEQEHLATFKITLRLSTLAVINSILVGFKIQSKRGKTCLLIEI